MYQCDVFQFPHPKFSNVPDLRKVALLHMEKGGFDTLLTFENLGRGRTRLTNLRKIVKRTSAIKY